MNAINLIGRLTKDIELKYTQAGKAVGTFTLAVNRSFKNAQGERETDFILCQVWDKSAENLANFTKKGSQIGIEGRIQTRNYENKEGQRVYVTEIVVNQFHLLEPRPQNEQQSGQQYQQQSNQPQATQSNYNYNGDSRMLENQQSSPFMEEGRPIIINEDDLPF